MDYESLYLICSSFGYYGHISRDCSTLEKSMTKQVNTSGDDVPEKVTKKQVTASGNGAW